MELKTHRAGEQVDDETVKVNEARAVHWIDCALNICRKRHKGHVSERVSLSPTLPLRLGNISCGYTLRYTCEFVMHLLFPVALRSGPSVSDRSLLLSFLFLGFLLLFLY